MRDMENKIFTQRYLSPCGELLLGSLDNRLCMCNWIVEKHPGRVGRRLQRMLNARFESSASPVIQEAAKQLDQYFGGERKTFDVPLLLPARRFKSKSGTSCLQSLMEQLFRMQLWPHR